MSVIVPCRNERDRIEACLRSILSLDEPVGGFEVIVADGDSDDGTREVLARMAREDARLIVVENPRQTTATGMNLAIRRARGAHIAIMGAHNRYAPDYLQQALNVLAQTGADNVGGTMICEGESVTQKAIAAAHHSGFAVGGARWHRLTYEGPADTVFGGVYPRSVFDRIGLFDEGLVRNQDDEFNLRLTRAGGRIWHSRRIRSWYTPRGSLRRLWRQYSQYGYWKVRVIQKHRIPASVRHLVPGLFISALVASLLVGIVWRGALLIFGGLVAAYAVGNLLATMAAARRHPGRVVLMLPLVFGCYHFAYGTGFLRGVWDFVIMRRGSRSRFSELTR